MTWSELGPSARAFRLAHIAWGIVGMATLGYVWLCALTRRRDRLLWVSMVFLSSEGVALIVGRGNCPFGPLQRRLGDSVPMFELVLPPRAAKAAIPILTAITLLGFLAVAVRADPRAAISRPPTTPAISGGRPDADRT